MRSGVEILAFLIFETEMGWGGENRIMRLVQIMMCIYFAMDLSLFLNVSRKDERVWSG